MSTRHLPHILLLIDTAGAYGRGIVEGVGRYAREHGPWSIQYEYRALDSLPAARLKRWRGDGVISRTVSPKDGKLLRAMKRPIVELHGHPKSHVAEVHVDSVVQARMAVSHFLDCGLRRFAFFAIGNTWWIKEHRDQYNAQLRQRGFDCQNYEATLFSESVPVWDDRQRPNVIKWLRSLQYPIGIFTIGDLHAVHLMDVCREANIAVPEETAILGCGNDTVICETVNPTLSSIDLNSRCIGYEAARLLDAKMSGKAADGDVAIAPSHVAVRQSTDIVPIDDTDVAHAVRFIRQFACTGIGVDCVAEEIGLSRRSLEYRFDYFFQRTPAAEIMRVRIENAKMLLTQTDQTIENVARRSGFASVRYFGRAFRREVGITPAAYRRSQRVSRN
jgi:LacI family transcriptional regulator